MNPELLLALGVVAIVLVNALARRVGVAAPLVLVLVGVGVSLLPSVPPVHVEPELILGGVLPLLLYSSAVSMPTMDFRRELRSISGLSVVLVVVTALGLGLFFSWAIPGLDLATAVALGAVISPTDAVATTIVKRLGAPPRVVTMLEGESLLNDASALVLLRSAIVATAAAVSFGSVVGDFVRAVVVAVVIGAVVGLLNLRVRRAVRNPSAGTALSLTAPFLASVPTEHFGASGLVAAVTAGLVTGQGSVRYLRAQDRVFERTTWSTVGMVLEGGLFLVMGLQLDGLIEAVQQQHRSAGTALALGACAVVITLLIRSSYVTVLLGIVARRTPTVENVTARLDHVQRRFDPGGARGGDTSAHDERVRAGWNRRVSRWRADVAYFERWPLGRREGALIVWAGMRGAVTVAAALTLPAGQDAAAESERALLVLIAYCAATLSLLVQGGTLAWVVGTLGLRVEPGEKDAEERIELLDAMSRAALEVVDDPGLRRADGGTYDPRALATVRDAHANRTREARDGDTAELGTQLLELRLRVIAAQRAVLVAAREEGAVSSAALTVALEILDAEQVSAELKTGDGDRH